MGNFFFVFFASQHKKPISGMPVRCSLKEDDTIKGVQTGSHNIAAKLTYLVIFVSLSNLERSQSSKVSKKPSSPKVPEEVLATDHKLPETR
ncbi:hypothetical protein Nmel_006972 [Mimus melanotis]